MFTTQLRLRGESRSGEGDPRLPPTFLHELCKLRESHWIWRHGSSHITWTWEVPFTRLTMRCTMHSAFADNPSTAGRLTSTTVLECPHDALSRTARRNLEKARSLSNTISATLNSGLLTAGRWRKYQLSLPVIRHPEQTKKTFWL